MNSPSGSRSVGTTMGVEMPTLGMNAVRLLTVYLVLLLAVPSSVRIAALGSMGRPSLLWGLGLFAWWAAWRLTARSGVLSAIRQPVRLAYYSLLVVALVSLAAALFRGQPSDQVSPAMTSILRLLSWGGALLIGLDGLRSQSQIYTLVRRIALAGGLLAALGLLQFVTRQSMLDWIGAIPGLEVESAGVQVRESFVRASGTAIHPLEHAAALSAALPLGVAVALHDAGDARLSRLRKAMAWLPVVIITLASILAVSRSALIGFAVAAVATLTAVPRRLRLMLIAAGGFAAAVAIAAVPGLFGVFRTLFEPGGDASTQSRTNALARLPEFISSSPIYGTGFGTFLPRYYIFDNAWVLMLVELGFAGLLAFAAIFVSSIVGAVQAGISSDAERSVMGRTLAASVLSIAVVFAFFDGMSFPIAAGLAFVLVGMCGAIRRIELSSLSPPGWEESADRVQTEDRE